ncbi:linear amide C-N hydrolase [Treponema sp.]|uniref:linear amide C-N hydrolase n=1 Tax=Treponema sp. TaxID=166 RepID=UPI003EFEF088
MICKPVLVVCSVAVFILAVFIALFFMFFTEIKIASSIKKLDAPIPVYMIQFDNDYHLDEIACSDIKSDAELASVLSRYISHGFYTFPVEPANPGCSTISARTPEGGMIWGRNFDWYEPAVLIVKCIPKNGYASVSTCEFSNITGSPSVLPDTFPVKMLALSSLFVPMDGINEAGLCVADLEVNEGGMHTVDTDKPNLTVTVAIRMILNKAATVSEAVEILKQYDIFPSGGISHHLAISDAAGNSVAVEFCGGQIVVVDTPVLTNFNTSGSDISAGGESSMLRWNRLRALWEESNGVLSTQEVKEALSSVAQVIGQWQTRWSIIYENEQKTARYYFSADFEKELAVQVPSGK